MPKSHLNSLGPLFLALRALEALEINDLPPSIEQINQVYQQLNTALSKGDPVAIPFLHYMYKKFPTVQGQYASPPPIDTLPLQIRLTQHWVEAYELYLQGINTIKKATTPQLIPPNTSRSQLQLITQQNEERRANAQREIDSIFDRFRKEKTLCHALGLLFAAKLNIFLLKKGCNSGANIDGLLQLASNWPNIWAKLEYYLYLQEKGCFNESLAEHQQLKIELGILELNQGNMSAVIDHYTRQNAGSNRPQDLAMITQWTSVAAHHGDPDALISIILFLLQEEDSPNEAKKLVQHLVVQSVQQNLTDVVAYFNLFSKNASTKLLYQFTAAILNVFSAKFDENPLILNIFLSKLTAFIMKDPVCAENRFSKAIAAYYLPKLTQVLGRAFQSNDHPDIKQTRIVSHFYEHPLLAQQMALYFEEAHLYERAENWWNVALSQNREDRLSRHKIVILQLLQKKDVEQNLPIAFALAEEGSIEALLAIGENMTAQALSSQDINRYRVLLQRYASSQHPAMSDVDSILPLLETLHRDKLQVEKNAACKARLDYLWAEYQEEDFEDLLQEYKGKSEKLYQTYENWVKKEQSSTGNASLSSAIKSIGPSSRVVTLETLSMASQQPPQEVHVRVLRATEHLTTLNAIDIRHITERHAMEAEHALNIIKGEPQTLYLSTRGATSGSRRQYGRFFFHALHGHDRPSYFARSIYKNVISNACKEATRYTENLSEEERNAYSSMK